MVQRAVRARWNIGHEIKDKIRRNILEILDDEEVGAKLKLEATKAAIAADKADLEELKIFMPRRIQRVTDVPTSQLLSELAEILDLPIAKIPGLANLVEESREKNA